jgi:Leucine-rich repeat (LRR) protein
LRVGKVAEAVLNSDMYRRPFEPVRHVREDDLAVLDGTTAHLTLAGARLRTAEPLRRFSALETLWLYGTPVADLAPLAGLAGLTTLWLADTPVADLAPLAGLAGLRELSLDGALVERDEPALEKLRQRGVSISI